MTARTPSVSLDQDGPLGCYIQWGAMADGGGLRVWDIAPANVQEVVRRHPRGSGFKRGMQDTDFVGGGDVAEDVAIQANGRIVAVGFAGGGATGDDFALARYNPNGSLDTSFSGDGLKRTSFSVSAFSDMANGVALQGDGRIVAVGTGNNEFSLARYLGG